MNPEIPRSPGDFSRRHFLRTAAGAAIIAPGLPNLLASAPAHAGSGHGRYSIVYVGTFTAGTKTKEPYNAAPGNGRGIHLFRFDSETGGLESRGVFESDTSPNWQAIDPAGSYLYSTNKNSGEPGTGRVSSFAIDRRDGALTSISTVDCGGAGPAHLSLHPSGRFVLVANYIGGSVAVVPIRGGGRLGEPVCVRTLDGPVGPPRAATAPPGSFAISGHESTHAHMILSDPSGRFVLAADLGSDRILTWKCDPHSGELTPADPAYVALPPGDGPRHFTFHPNGRLLYSLQEEASTIAVFEFNPGSGRLTPRQTISSLPPGFEGTAFASAIRFSPEGRHLYAANRLHDSIAWFDVHDDGLLRFAGAEWTRGDYPRHFSFDPTGRFLCCGNNRSDSLTTFRRDPATGALTFTGEYAAVGSPSCVQFLEL